MIMQMQITAYQAPGSDLAFHSNPPKAAINAEVATALNSTACNGVEYDECCYKAGQPDDNSGNSARVENSFAHMLQITTETAVCNG